MDEYQDQATNGQVIFGAGLVAAVLAAVALLLSRRKPKPKTAAERVGETVEATLGQARDAAQRLIAQVPDGSRELDRAGREARRLFNLGSHRGHELVRDVEEQAQRLSKQAQHTGDQAATSAQHFAAHAASAAIERAERALEAGAHLAGAAREQAPRVAQRVNDEIVPTLRDIASQAAEAAVERWHEARERAAEHPMADLRRLESQAAHLAEAGGDLARGTGAAVADRAAGISRRAAEATEHTVDRARDVTKKGAEATVSTSKDTGALLFWVGAAAGLIFYALLNEERREQITQAVQAVINDIQGYDDEF